MANGKLGYWKVKIAALEQKLAGAKADLEKFELDTTVFEIDTLPKRVFIGRKHLEHQVKYWERELDKANKALYKRARYLVHWHNQKIVLEQDIKQIGYQIDRFKVQATELAAQLVAQIGNVTAIDIAKNNKQLPVLISKLEALRAIKQECLEIHIRKTPADSILEAELMLSLAEDISGTKEQNTQENNNANNSSTTA